MVLGGCFGEGPGDLFDDYQTKIARVQDADEIEAESEERGMCLIGVQGNEEGGRIGRGHRRIGLHEGRV